MKTFTIMLLMMISFGANAQNESFSLQKKNYLSLELDPAPFILGGYSFSLKYSTDKLPHVTFMGSIYSSKFPDKMMSKDNLEKGFRNLKINTSYAFFADYFFREDRTGFHFGPSVFYYSKTIGSNSSSVQASFKSLFPNIRVGYMYKPFKNSGFYLNPWVNVGKELLLDDGNKIEGQEFSLSAVSYIVALHIGYQVKF